MKISAGLIIRNEASRYLGYALENLSEVADEVCIYDDGSSDGWRDVVPSGLRDLRILKADVPNRDSAPAFHRHAIGRNALLKFTLEGHPEWVIATDADELLTDPAALRAACERTTRHVLTVEISEAWEVCSDVICTREDGGWRSHPIGAVWRASSLRRQVLSLADKDTATGRVPDVIHRVPSEPSGVGLVHLGWANEGERRARYERHVGSAHSRAHVESILWRDGRVRLAARQWPASWSDGLRVGVLERANRG